MGQALGNKRGGRARDPGEPAHPPAGPLTRAETRARPGQGSGHVISFIAVFGIVNGIGGLAGTALLGTYQIVREKANSAGIVQGIDPTDPIVTQRLTAGGQAVARVVGDPALRSAEGGALLSQTATREANVLAYDDTFRLVAILAAATFLYLVFLLIRRARRARRAALAGAPRRMMLRPGERNRRSHRFKTYPTIFRRVRWV